jgi:hypothetical protein
MAVTELDVTTGSANPSPTVLATQANQYGQLFKCFVERSYFSGRGKIISVSKDGLNDQYTYKTNQSSSLWDAQNQCKPAFFAVVEVGKNYNALDSLIAHADTLQESEYTADSWANFAATLASAKSAMAQNYSPAVSAADALGGAKDNLIAAIEGLVKVTTGVADLAGNTPKVFSLSQNYPNPFWSGATSRSAGNPTTQISYSIPQNGYISLKVYNLLGDEVATLFEGVQLAGNHVASFNGAELASGVYLYQLKANNFTEVKRLILLK